MGESVDLDYDDELAEDAQHLHTGDGQEALLSNAPKHRGAGTLPGAANFSPGPRPATAWKQVITVARQVYGESNCRYADDFYHWATDVLADSIPTVDSTKSLLQELYEERNYWGPRAQWQRKRGKANSRELIARWNAVLCAQAACRIVLNLLNGRDITQWILRCLHRASLTEGVDLQKSLGRGKGREGAFKSLS